MHPGNIAFEDCDFTKVLRVVDKETQTKEPSASKDSPTSVSRSHQTPHTPREIKKSEKGSVTVFGFSHVIQDPNCPKLITIVRETVTEEIHNHSTGSSTEDTSSNRYRYCQEVIKPYLKSHRQDCPDSEEKLVRDALDSANEEFPDCQPCFEKYDENKGEKKEKSSSSQSCFSKIDAVTSCQSKFSSQKMDPNKGKDCPPKKEDSATLKNQRPGCASDDASTAKPPDPCEKPPKAPTCKPKDRSPPPCPPNPCENPPKPACKPKDPPPPPCSPDPSCPPKPKDSCSNPKPDCPPPADSCKKALPEDKCPKKKKCSSDQALGKSESDTAKSSKNCDSKQSFYDTKESSTRLHSERNGKTMIDAHNETMTTIKTAMEDFLCKVYKTTQDAVTLIKTESAKQIEIFKKSTSSNTDSCIVAKKTSEDKSAETVTSFNFLRKIQGQDRKENSAGREDDSINPAEIYSKLADKVDSTLTVLSEHINIDKLTDIFKPSKFNDMSSPFDIPTPPKDVSHVITSNAMPVMPVTNSVFAAIKTKIYSIFSDSENNTKQAVSRTSSFSSTSSKEDSSDDDVINKVIE